MRSMHKNDPVHSYIPISELESKIISSSLFNRLQYITQTSTSYFSFPSLKHTRYSHSIGTMHLSGIIFNSILRNTEKSILDTLNSSIKKIIHNDILRDESAMIALGDSVKNYLPHVADKSSIETLDTKIIKLDYLIKNGDNAVLLLLESIRIAGLLHDVGHMPFSHLVEHVLEGLHPDLKDNENRNVREEKAHEILTEMLGEDEDDKIHEYIGRQITNLIFITIINDYGKKNDRDGILMTYIIWRLVTYIYTEKETEDFSFKKIHALIDGPIDSDRIDYTLRDIFQSGLNLSSFDSKMILDNYAFNEKFDLVLPYFSLQEIERFFVSRYESYNDVIFHHKVSRTNRILEEVLKIELELYLDDDTRPPESSEKYALRNHIAGLFDVLEKLVEGNHISAQKTSLINQFEENWLLSLLKNIKFRLLAKSDSLERLSQKEKFLLSALSDALDDEENFYTIWENNLSFKEDLKKYLGLQKSIIKKDFNSYYEVFKRDYIDNTTNKQYKDRMKAILDRINESLQDGESLLAIKKGFKGAGGIENIYISSDDGSPHTLADVSAIQGRLLSRRSENIPIFFVSNSANKEKTKKILLKEIVSELNLHLRQDNLYEQIVSNPENSDWKISSVVANNVADVKAAHDNNKNTKDVGTREALTRLLWLLAKNKIKIKGED